MEGASKYDLPMWLNVYADLLDVFADHKVSTVVNAFETGELDKEDLVENARMRLQPQVTFRWMAACREMADRFEDEFYNYPAERAPTETQDGEPAYPIEWDEYRDDQWYLSTGVEFLIRGHSDHGTYHKRPTDDGGRYMIVVE